MTYRGTDSGNTEHINSL